MQISWHSISGDEVLARLDSRPEGLSEKEAARRLKEHGPNRLPEDRPASPLIRFLRQFHNVLIYVLLAAAVITALMGEWLNTAIIAGVAVLNALIGFIQEGKAEAALAAIRKMLSVSATVVRGGEDRRIPAEELVLGEIVLLASGDRVPADLRLLETRNLLIDEAALTGESQPAAKGTGKTEPDTPLGDRTPLAFSGTLVVSGRGNGVVTATGMETELGKVNRLVSEVEEETTPLLAEISRLVRLLTGIILTAGAAFFLFGILVRGRGWEETFLMMVAVAVAAIPEGLPAIISITLALGVQRMAKRRAIIRRLPAVETLGSVTVICTDKTGTLTLHEMSVREVILKDGEVAAEGLGYRPEGELRIGGRKVEFGENRVLDRLLFCSALGNEGRLRESKGAWRVEGDPTEGALLALAARGGIDLDRAEAANPRLDLVPFESETKLMATLNRGEKGTVIWMKGAPERVLARCRFQLTTDGEEAIDPIFWEEKIRASAARGRRVLALATKKVGGEKTALGAEDLEGMTLLGLAGIFDPPRPESAAAVAECCRAGIKVKMITGDHGTTALAIAKEIGIPGNKVLTGRELGRLAEEELARLAAEVNVFARVSPEDKLRLVRALRDWGEVTAMTGDGVNDAPALKQADIGIAMGIKGTEAAKEAAEMVLADDNFASIVHAVEEGRTVYDNIRKSLAFLLPTNGGEALVIVAALLLGMELPITALQILWVNMVTAVSLGMALGFDPPEGDLMDRPPRSAGTPLLPFRLIVRVAWASLLLAAGAFPLFLWARFAGASLETARTLAVNGLIAGEVFYLFNSRRLDRHSFSFRLFFSNPAALIAVGAMAACQAVFTYLPLFNKLFGTAPLVPRAWLSVLGVGAAVFLLVEAEKFLSNRSRKVA
jgi:magnesium-transporting ATPase (P-type)